MRDTGIWDVKKSVGMRDEASDCVDETGATLKA